MKSRLSKLALFSWALASMLLMPRVAAAVYQCGDQHDDCLCGANDPYPCCDNGGNCTWWAWEAACCNWAVGLPGWGNANQWAGNASADPNYEVLSSPVVGSIACRVSGTYGHVAWVTAVNGSSITVTEENCCGACNYGMRSWDYNASFFDGGFIIRKGQCDCTAGQTQDQGCGNCGTQSRGCGDDCKWGAWGSCDAEGACADGQTEEQSCGDCGTQSRACDAGCQWSDFGACSGPDPNGGDDPCESGLKGVCADGTLKCVAGTVACQPGKQPSGEVCDGLDNDCDGQVDESDVCGGASPGDGGSGAGNPAAAAGGGDSAPLTGSCSCRSAQQPSWAAWPTAGSLLALIGLRMRRGGRRRARMG